MIKATGHVFSWNIKIMWWFPFCCKHSLVFIWPDGEKSIPNIPQWIQHSRGRWHFACGAHSFKKWLINISLEHFFLQFFCSSGQFTGLSVDKVWETPTIWSCFFWKMFYIVWSTDESRQDVQKCMCFTENGFMFIISAAPCVRKTKLKQVLFVGIKHFIKVH